MVTDSAALLRERGIQVTAQRLAVLRAVAGQPHITADAVAEVVRIEIGAISLQSVYDALGLLVCEGLIRRIQPSGSPARFEDRVHDNHHHLIVAPAAASSTSTARSAPRLAWRLSTIAATKSTRPKSPIGGAVLTVWNSPARRRPALARTTARAGPGAGPQGPRPPTNSPKKSNRIPRSNNRRARRSSRG